MTKQVFSLMIRLRVSDFSRIRTFVPDPISLAIKTRPKARERSGSGQGVEWEGFVELNKIFAGLSPWFILADGPEPLRANPSLLI